MAYWLTQSLMFQAYTKETWGLHGEEDGTGGNVSEDPIASIFRVEVLEMEAAESSETLVLAITPHGATVV